MVLLVFWGLFCVLIGGFCLVWVFVTAMRFQFQFQKLLPFYTGRVCLTFLLGLMILLLFLLL